MKKENWEKEFDKKIGEIFGENKILEAEEDFPYLPNWLSKRNRKVKSFIRQEKAKDRQKFVEEIEKWIEEMSKNPKITNVGEIFFELSKLKSHLQALKDEK